MNCNTLIQKYRSLFDPEEIIHDETKSCMVWGIECDNGWYDILDEMMAKIASLNLPPEFTFSQIKEKFATLRVYTSYCDERVEKIIEEAEAKSAVTCEICGKPGTVNQEGWRRCRCVDCETKR